MRPAGAHFRRHAVTLRAHEHSDGVDLYAQWEGRGGVAVTFPDPDADPPRRGANVQPSRAAPREIAEQPKSTTRLTIYLDENPDLTDPAGNVRKLDTGDGVELPNHFPAGTLGKAVGPMTPATTDAAGNVVAWAFDAEFIR